MQIKLYYPTSIDPTQIVQQLEELGHTIILKESADKMVVNHLVFDGTAPAPVELIQQLGSVLPRRFQLERSYINEESKGMVHLFLGIEPAGGAVVPDEWTIELYVEQSQREAYQALYDQLVADGFQVVWHDGLNGMTTYSAIVPDTGAGVALAEVLATKYGIPTNTDKSHKRNRTVSIICCKLSPKAEQLLNQLYELPEEEAVLVAGRILNNDLRSQNSIEELLGRMMQG